MQREVEAHWVLRAAEISVPLLGRSAIPRDEDVLLQRGAALQHELGGDFGGHGSDRRPLAGTLLEALPVAVNYDAAEQHHLMREDKRLMFEVFASFASFANFVSFVSFTYCS